MSTFPKANTTTRSNSTAQFLDWFKTPMPSWGAFEHAPRMAEKLKPPPEVFVRLKAPFGLGAIQTLSNRHITIGQDGIVEMSAEDAACLIPSGWTKLDEG